MSAKEKIILPPKYYLDYFRYVLDFIQQGSSHLLGTGDREFLLSFKELSEDAQCLLVRMLNRKGEYFRLDKFTYDEIENIPKAADELRKQRMISLDPPDDALLFRLFTKLELHILYPRGNFSKKHKEDVILELAEENSPDDYLTLKRKYTIMQVLVQEQIEYLKLLFFGHAHGMMTEFVMRDIGNIKLENLENHTFTPWFDSEIEARAVFELYKWNRTFRQAKEVLLPEELKELISPVNWDSFLHFKKSRKIGDKLMLRLAEYLEKSGFPEDALNYYSLAQKHPARERRIRILDRIGKNEDAKILATMVVKNPYNASEQIFATDYLAKTTKRHYRSTTTKINSSPEIIITAPEGHRVEAHALSYFSQQGYDGVHSENYLWRALFGLLFWEELFDQQYATFHHPLQRMPSDLHSDVFYETRKTLLIQKTKTFTSKNKLFQYIKAIYQEKETINNPLVSWHETLPPTLEACIHHLPLKGLLNVLLEIAKNVKDNGSGFPDLFIWKEDDYHFYEIKSPNDHLSAQQLFWINFLNEQNIKAEILRIRYE